MAEALEERVSRLEGRVENFSERFDSIERRFESMERRINDLDNKIDRFRYELSSRIDGLQKQMWGMVAALAALMTLFKFI